MIRTPIETLSRLKELRKEIHQHPEVSENEYETAKRIEQYLDRHIHKGKHRRIAKTGVLVQFSAKDPGFTTMLRADTDALPIQEVNEFEHQSIHPGVSHKCGHDGHTVMMLGVCEYLENNPPPTGTVLLLFQPAEENGMGAAGVLEDDAFKLLSIDFVYALHNLPGFPTNNIVIKENVFNANVKSLIVRLDGRTAHAAEPEKGENPALAMAEILHYCAYLTKNEPDQGDFFLVTPVHLNMGEVAYGISAGQGEIHLTIRSWDLSLFEKKTEMLLREVEKICLEQNLKFNTEWLQTFYANINHPTATDTIRKAANKAQFVVQEMTQSFKWGEDFGLFTQRYPGAMFGLGAGIETPALHNPDYDFPDEITETGIAQFVQILQLNHY